MREGELSMGEQTLLYRNQHGLENNCSLRYRTRGDRRFSGHCSDTQAGELSSSSLNEQPHPRPAQGPGGPRARSEARAGFPPVTRLTPGSHQPGLGPTRDQYCLPSPWSLLPQSWTEARALLFGEGGGQEGQ